MSFSIGPLAYQHERLFEAVKVLATASGSQRERLKLAFQCFCTVGERDFAQYPELQGMFTTIMDSLRVVADEQRGSAAASIDAMHWRQQRRLAERIVDLFERISEVHHSRLTP